MENRPGGDISFGFTKKGVEKKTGYFLIGGVPTLCMGKKRRGRKATEGFKQNILFFLFLLVVCCQV